MTNGREQGRQQIAHTCEFLVGRPHLGARARLAAVARRLRDGGVRQLVTAQRSRHRIVFGRHGVGAAPFPKEGGAPGQTAVVGERELLPAVFTRCTCQRTTARQQGGFQAL